MDELGKVTLERAKEIVFTEGHAKGKELGRSIIQDLWDRQAFLMERKQREMKICEEKYNRDVALEYNRGFTQGLMTAHEDAEVADDVKVEFEGKIKTWVDTLRQRAADAKNAGGKAGESMMDSARRGHWIEVNHWITQAEEELREKYRGVEAREYRAAYTESVGLMMHALGEDSKEKVKNLQLLGAPIIVL